MFISWCKYIKEENIIDSNAAWTEANIVYLTTNKTMQNTFIVCIRSQNLQKDETLCYNKKTQSLLRLLGGLRAMNGRENVKYNLQAFTP